MTDNPQIDDFEVTAADIGDAEADAENRNDDLLRAVLTALAIFSIANLRWETTLGQTVDEQRLLEILAQEERERGLDLYAALTSGQIDVARWLGDMATNLRRFHLQATAIGRGGFDAITETDLQRVSNWLETEFSYLRGFGDAVLEMSEAGALNRLQLYYNHAQSTFWEARRETAGELNYTEERRYLGVADHCDPCVGVVNLGWQPIGTTPVPGTICEGGSNCACGMEFR